MQSEPQKIVVVLPNWIGDVTMASPTLAALRSGLEHAKITYLLRPYLAELVGGSPWYDQLLFWPARSIGKGNDKQTMLKLIRQLRAEQFDTVVLLANSFRSALVASLAKIPRRIGYDRDGRGMLLTDKLLPDRYNGQFLPISAVKYYLGLADYLGCARVGMELTLHTEPQYEQEVDSLYIRHGLERSAAIAVMNPGAGYGPAKCWPAERFAQVGDQLVERFGMQVIIACGPRDKHIAITLAKSMKNRAIALGEPVVGLGTLKALVKRSKLVVTNDTGPRHLAAAFGVPVVTIFGPTDPRWADTLYVKEKQVMVKVDCGPCMKRNCPRKDHRCMLEIPASRVIEEAEELLSEAAARDNR